MYLGFFFVHWSGSETNQVYQSDPFNIEECPFCKQPTSIVYKIYNIKTKHYSAFSIGKGDFSASFVCRNCTTEGTLEKDVESRLIGWYLMQVEYSELVELYKSKPEKAKKKLEKLIRKSKGLDTTELQTTFEQWSISRQST